MFSNRVQGLKRKLKVQVFNPKLLSDGLSFRVYWLVEVKLGILANLIFIKDQAQSNSSGAGVELGNPNLVVYNCNVH